jgi:hypothetical protein
MSSELLILDSNHPHESGHRGCILLSTKLPEADVSVILYHLSISISCVPEHFSDVLGRSIRDTFQGCKHEIPSHVLLSSSKHEQLRQAAYIQGQRIIDKMQNDIN